MELLMSTEIDYRMIYKIEEEFSRRMLDVYTGKQTVYRAPKFTELLGELLDIEASLYLMLHKNDAFQDMSDAEFLKIEFGIKDEDPDALNLVISRMEKEFVYLFTRDVWLYLQHNNLFFLEDEPYSIDYTCIYNSPISAIW